MYSSLQKAKIYKKMKEVCLVSTPVTKPETSKVLVYSKSNLFRTRDKNGQVK